MELEVFDGWTIDRRLKQLRKIDEQDKILFVDFDSDLGQMIFEKKILVEELEILKQENDLRKGKKDGKFLFVQDYDLEQTKNEIETVSKVINKLERELK